jgi:lysophospholipase L1-like esterase
VQVTVATGRVRLFGYRFDKDQPGIQYSSLGVNGAQVSMILFRFEPTRWAQALRHEDPSLVVLNYGTNESMYPGYVHKQYQRELRRLVTELRQALPHASILLMGPMDHGLMGAGGAIATPDAVPDLIEIQMQVAAENNCAYFNTFQAMGGEGTMAQWYQSRPRLVSADFIHPMPEGAAIVGSLFEKALVKSYQESKMKIGQLQ